MHIYILLPFICKDRYNYMHEAEHDFLRLYFMFQDFVDIFMSGGLRDPNDPFLRYILIQTGHCGH